MKTLPQPQTAPPVPDTKNMSASDMTAQKDALYAAGEHQRAYDLQSLWRFWHWPRWSYELHYGTFDD